MVAELRVNVNSVVKELDIAMSVLTEARIVSKYRRLFKGKGLDMNISLGAAWPKDKDIVIFRTDKIFDTGQCVRISASISGTAA